MVAGVVDEGLLVDVLAVGEDDECLDGFARVRVRDADDTRFGDAGVAEQDLFDLGGKHVEARDDDQVLGAVDEVDEAVLVAVADVARAQLTVSGDDPFGRLRVVEVAGEHVRPADPQLSASLTSTSSPVSSTMRRSMPSSTAPTEPRRGVSPVEEVTTGDASVRP